jgi:hypothetical protein
MSVTSVFFCGATVRLGARLPHGRGFEITHTHTHTHTHAHTPQSVVFLWTRDRPVAETSFQLFSILK